MTGLRGFKFVITLVLVLKKIQSDDKTKYDTFYLHPKAETIINESDIDDVFESIYTTITSNILKSLEKVSGSVIDSFIKHDINISKYNPLVSNSYLTIPKELDHPRKRLINIQNINDNECCKWCLVSTIGDKDLAKKLDFKGIKFPVKVRDIHKIEKKNSVGISVLVMKIGKISNICIKKKYCEEKHIDSLLIRVTDKTHYVLIKDFNTFTYNHTLLHGKRYFCLQVIVYKLSLQKKY